MFMSLPSVIHTMHIYVYMGTRQRKDTPVPLSVRVERERKDEE
jgi:hypothetical protein